MKNTLDAKLLRIFIQESGEAVNQLVYKVIVFKVKEVMKPNHH